MTSREIRIGVVCEGRTDFAAFFHFVGNTLDEAGVQHRIFPIQPRPDNTSNGGWTEVVFWLEDNDPASRVASLFGGGVFAGEPGGISCDFLIIHIDADVLDDQAFASFMSKKGLAVSSPIDPADRADEVKRILSYFTKCDDLNETDTARHIIFPAVESTETWCIAAFSRLGHDPESLKGQALWDAFGNCIVKSEGKTPVDRYGAPDKTVKRRFEFCARHKKSTFIKSQSRSFSIGVDALMSQIPKQL